MCTYELLVFETDVW